MLSQDATALGYSPDAPCRGLPADDGRHTPKTWTTGWQFGFGHNAIRHVQQMTYCDTCGRGIAASFDELPRGGA